MYHDMPFILLAMLVFAMLPMALLMLAMLVSYLVSDTWSLPSLSRSTGFTGIGLCPAEINSDVADRAKAEIAERWRRRLSKPASAWRAK